MSDALRIVSRRAANFKNLEGRRFGRLIAISLESTNAGHARWLCRCDCGKEKIVRGGYLLSVPIPSCGCFARERNSESHKKHGKSGTPIHWAWIGIRSRCLNEGDEDFKNYGGRGITMHPVFQESFQAFSDELGPRPTPQHSVGRIDNERGYEPGNIRWETSTQQNNNRRSSRIVVYHGEKMTMMQLAKKAGLRWGALAWRIDNMGMTPDEAADKPLGNSGPKNRALVSCVVRS